MLLRIGEIVARKKRVELIEIINKIIVVASSWLFNIIVSMMHGRTDVELNAVQGWNDLLSLEFTITEMIMLLA